MYRNSCIAKRLDPEVQIEKPLKPDWNQIPLNSDTHCLAKQYKRNVPNLELNYIITVLQLFMD